MTGKQVEAALEAYLAVKAKSFPSLPRDVGLNEWEHRAVVEALRVFEDSGWLKPDDPTVVIHRTYFDQEYNQVFKTRAGVWRHAMDIYGPDATPRLVKPLPAAPNVESRT